MYVHTCWKRRDTASDNGVASRQRKSSHEKCTPRRNLPDNKVEREENRTRDHTVPSFDRLLFPFFFFFFFFFFFSFSLFAQRSGVAATGAPIHEILLITRSFETGKPCTTASWNYRVFCRRYASNGINSPTRTRHVPRTIRCPRVCYYLSV